MILYLTIITISMLIISIFNFLVCNMTFLNAMLFTVIFTLEEVIINAICAIVISKVIKNKRFNENSFLYNTTKSQMNFYDKLKIKLWKDKVPDLGRLGGFKKNKIEQPNDIEYLNKYIYEINNGLLVHFVSLFAGFAILLCPPYWYFAIKIPVSIVSFILNLLPIFILKYNKYKLEKIIKYKTKKDEVKSNEQTSN